MSTPTRLAVIMSTRLATMRADALAESLTTTTSSNKQASLMGN